MTELILIAIINVLIIDKSGILSSIEEVLERVFKVRKARVPKPFSCSLCMTWWGGLIYLAVIGNISFLNVAVLLFIAYMTSIISELFTLIHDILMKIITWLEDKL